MIGVGSDHFCFELKERLRSFLAESGEKTRDFGTFSDAPNDYPDVAMEVAEAVRAGRLERGILVCGTGLGMAIAANKVPGIFAAPVTDLFTARKARESNNAQIITLGANVVAPERACRIVEVWLTVEFRGGRSARKVGKILVLEERYRKAGKTVLTAGGYSC